MANNTVNLHRVIKASPDKVFRAFAHADAIASWLPPYGFICTVHEMDFKEGGSYKMSFYNFTTQQSQSFGGTYLELKPGSLLRYSDHFDDPNMPGEMTTTVTLKQVLCGTEMTVTQEGIPAAIPVEFCYLGWQESLDKLMRLVEPEINQ